MTGRGLITRLGRSFGTALLCLGLAAAAIPAQAAADVTPEEADADQRTAYYVVDGYWRQHWSQYFAGSYSPPRVVGLYDSRMTPMPCDGSLWTSNNAWYCGSTDSVGFDLVFMQRVYELGDSFIYLVVAHEWAHAIQARLRPDVRAVAYELQADCLAGAAMYGATADGALQWDEGDADELVYALHSLGDATPWTRPGDHGSPEERLAHFRMGGDGPLACLPNLAPQKRTGGF